MRRPVTVLFLACALLAAACGAGGSSAEDEEETPTEEASATSDTVEFGTMASPCGSDVDGVKVSVDPEDAGRGTDRLYVGVANDRTTEVRPGLLKEMYDAMVAFAGWCNAQGGIGGLPIEVVDLDGQVFKVEKAMTTACNDTFAMVGGGFTQDNLVFTGKDGSDFHRCGMIAFTGFAVSTEFADADGVIQPLPNSAYEKPIGWMEDIKTLHPEEVGRTTFVYGEGLTSIRVNKDQNKAVADAVGYGFVDDITYSLLNQDFSVTAQKILDLGATAVNFIGEPENFAALLAELTTKGFGGVVFSAANEYDAKLFSRGPDAADGAIVNLAIHAFEEADQWPATRQFLDAMEEHGPPEAKIAYLGVHSWSAGLLFAESVRRCAASTGGQIDRDCVMQAAADIGPWDGGGLHVEGDPSGSDASSCSMLFEAREGGFVRLFPELGSPEDDGEGFHCIEDGVIPLEGDFGQGVADPSRPY